MSAPILWSAPALQVPGWLAPEWLLAGCALLGITLAVVLAISLARANRRAVASSAREIARAYEEIAEGRHDHLPEFDSADPLGPAASALARLSSALQAQRQEMDRRIKTLEEILVCADDTPILLADPDGDLRYASPGAESLFGWRSGEGRGRPLASIFAGDEFETLLPKLSRKSLKDSALSHSTRLIDQRGAPFGAEVKIASFRNLPGGGEGFFLKIRDLRQEETLRAELRDSEQRYRALAESLPLALLVVQEGKILFANESLKEMLQIRDGLIGSDVREHLAAEDLLSVLDRLRRTESGEEPAFELECRLRSPHARWPIEVSLRAARVFYGPKPAVIVALRDAGPDRGLLRQVRVSEAKLDAALGASDEAVLLLSAAPSGGTVTLANHRFEEMFGFDVRTLTGLSVAELADRLAPLFGDAAAVRGHLIGGSAEGASQALASFDTVGAPRRTIELVSREAHSRDGRLIGRVLSARDVTLHRENERRLAREAAELARTRDLLERANRDLATLNDEVLSRSAEIEKANQELRTLDEMKSNLLANVSHELQTPLVSIKGYTEMILKGRLGSVTEEQRKGLEVSLRNIDRLIGMINNLLNFSRIERDMAGMRITSFALPELVEEAIELVRDRAEQRRISLTSRYLTDDLTVKADRDKIAQVFINLLENAVKYNRDGGQVQVEVRKGKKGYLIVDVRDTGIGIPRESLDKIFDRLYRVGNEATTGAPGSGIGLSIVRDILRMHGCIIKAESSLGEGTVFTFTLPVSSPQEPLYGDGPPNSPTSEPAPRGSLPRSI